MMVIGYYDVETQMASMIDLAGAADPAVDSHNKAHSFVMKLLQGGYV
jgi:hypothetical protein